MYLLAITMWLVITVVLYIAFCLGRWAINEMCYRCRLRRRLDAIRWA